MFRWCGIAFHEIGPCTADELSNRVRFAAELVLLLGGTTAKFPCVTHVLEFIPVKSHIVSF